VESEDEWHVDVAQKVPLNLDRDNITASYLRTLRTMVLNEMHQQLTTETATAGWVREAIGDERAEPEAVRSVVTKLYGENAVIFDPSDHEANKIAAAQGRTVIPPRAFDRQTWQNVKNTGAFLPAGKVTPSNSMIELSTEGKPPIPQDDWTPGMHRVADYAMRVAKAIMGVDIAVEITRLLNEPFLAAYGSRRIIFNLGRLGHKFFDSGNLEDVDELLIHEFGHEYSPDHLSSSYHDALCRLGARLRTHAASLPF
jgi:hypothetical protein